MVNSVRLHFWLFEIEWRFLKNFLSWFIFCRLFLDGGCILNFGLLLGIFWSLVIIILFNGNSLLWFGLFLLSGLLNHLGWLRFLNGVCWLFLDRNYIWGLAFHLARAIETHIRLILQQWCCFLGRVEILRASHRAARRLALPHGAATLGGLGLCSARRRQISLHTLITLEGADDLRALISDELDVGPILGHQFRKDQLQ